MFCPGIGNSRNELRETLLIYDGALAGSELEHTDEPICLGQAMAEGAITQTR